MEKANKHNNCNTPAPKEDLSKCVNCETRNTIVKSIRIGKQDQPLTEYILENATTREFIEAPITIEMII